MANQPLLEKSPVSGKWEGGRYYVKWELFPVLYASLT